LKNDTLQVGSTPPHGLPPTRESQALTQALHRLTQLHVWFRGEQTRCTCGLGRANQVHVRFRGWRAGHAPAGTPSPLGWTRFPCAAGRPSTLATASDTTGLQSPFSNIPNSPDYNIPMDSAMPTRLTKIKAVNSKHLVMIPTGLHTSARNWHEYSGGACPSQQPSYGW
jgi:hypothetical protein